MTTSIKDGIYAYVGGTVSRLFETKNGPAFNMEIPREGAQYPDRVTVWGAADGLNVGDRVKVHGWLSWRRQVKDDKTYLNVSINKPEVTDHEPAQPAAESQWADGQPPEDPWAGVDVAQYDGGTPF